MKVSVIIPAYNVEAFLSQAVDSVFATGYPDIEVLVVEDGSVDDTLAVAKAFQAKNADRVKLLRHKGGKNRGAGASRNLGISHATGDIIAFLDADDEYLPNRFETSVQILSCNPRIDGVYEKTAIKVEPGGRSLIARAPQGVLGLEGRGCRDILEAVLMGSWHTNAITLRRRVFSFVGLFNSRLRLYQDIELWIRLATTCCLVEGSKDRPVAFYRRHEGNRAPESSTMLMIRVLGNAILFGRKRRIPQNKLQTIEETFERIAWPRLGWLIDNRRLREAQMIYYWTARLYPAKIVSRHLLGNLRNVFWREARRFSKTCLPRNG